MEISDGTIDITASDDGLNAAGGNDQSGEITLEDADGNTLVSYTPMRE